MDGSESKRSRGFAGLVAALFTTAAPAAASPPFVPGAGVDVGLPSELAALIWIPVIGLTVACALALAWALRGQSAEQRRARATARRQEAIERKAYRRAVDQYLRDARKARSRARRDKRASQAMYLTLPAGHV